MAGKASRSGVRIISAISAFLLIATLAAAAVIYAPVFEGLRQSTAAGTLTDAFERPVTVTGAVDVVFGANIHNRDNFRGR